MSSDPNDPALAKAMAEDFRATMERLEEEIGRAVVGQREVVRGVLTALVADGHALLEGVPGLAKTLLVRTLAQCLHVEFRRIQFTPDLMPADIVGTTVLHRAEGAMPEFRFEPGPLHANFILADEINRATPKTQSALLEAMQERTITVGQHTRALPEPFIVLATQNPVEQEGTYPLPEAQLDRFLLKLIVGYPAEVDYEEILDRTTGASRPDVQPVASGEDILRLRRTVRSVPVPDHVRRYVVKLVMATQPGSDYAPELVNRTVSLGSSPRGAQALLLCGKVRALMDGRFAVSTSDIDLVANDALRHRVLLNFEGQAERKTPDDIVAAAIAAVREWRQG